MEERNSGGYITYEPRTLLTGMERTVEQLQYDHQLPLTESDDCGRHRPLRSAKSGFGSQWKPLFFPPRKSKLQIPFRSELMVGNEVDWSFVHVKDYVRLLGAF
ncbi:hypothetical protein F2P81_010065 [Scophthalmus maximus]|uniref:Uncharacterized protein n=1 Tax=Scophthalmus maximus TaxID=52904 RepID=A0A6A4T1S7_SCOMX|nr:hypothetical protein F2P81_010065 [Scophthalmus maximus]